LQAELAELRSSRAVLATFASTPPGALEEIDTRIRELEQQLSVV
jgi:hypothetical protein